MRRFAVIVETAGFGIDLEEVYRLRVFLVPHDPEHVAVRFVADSCRCVDMGMGKKLVDFAVLDFDGDENGKFTHV